MCGIFALLNKTDINHEFILEQFNKSQHRGPDNSHINTENNNFIGFHRLAINGLDTVSNQPITINNILLICNGEIYNYKELYNNIPYNPTTNSDCEVIIYLYLIYGIEYTLNLLDGVFAFVLIDYNINKLYSNNYFTEKSYYYPIEGLNENFEAIKRENPERSEYLNELFYFDKNKIPT